MLINNNKLYIYCDGGCRLHTSKVGGYGIVLRYNGVEKTLLGAEENTTNNKMELMAAIVALDAIKDKSKETIVMCDSKYVVDGMTEWIHDWLKNNWKNGSRKIKNVELWQRLQNLRVQFKNIMFVHCFGHGDTEGNNKADRLANIAMDKLEKQIGYTS